MRMLESLPSVKLDDRHLLPRVSGIYFVCGTSEIFYIGKSFNLNKRWELHHRQFQLELLSKLESIKIYWIKCDSNALTFLEETMISFYKPLMNNTKTLQFACELSEKPKEQVPFVTRGNSTFCVGDLLYYLSPTGLDDQIFMIDNIAEKEGKLKVRGYPLKGVHKGVPYIYLEESDMDNCHDLRFFI